MQLVFIDKQCKIRNHIVRIIEIDCNVLKLHEHCVPRFTPTIEYQLGPM